MNKNKLKMGQKISLDEQFNKNEYKCHLCSYNVNKEDLILCVRCNTALHVICHNKISNKTYTQCPNCNRIGSLGINLEHAFLKNNKVET